MKALGTWNWFKPVLVVYIFYTCKLAWAINPACFALLDSPSAQQQATSRGVEEIRLLPPSQAIRIWQEDGVDINDFLFGKKRRLRSLIFPDLESQITSVIASIDRAIDGHTIQDPLVVYRGTIIENGIVVPAVNDVVTFDGFLSTTFDLRKASEWAGMNLRHAKGILYVIHLKPPQIGLPVNQMINGHFRDENELLLPRKTVMVIRGKVFEPVTSTWILDAEILVTPSHGTHGADQSP